MGYQSLKSKNIENLSRETQIDVEKIASQFQFDHPISTGSLAAPSVARMYSA